MGDLGVQVLAGLIVVVLTAVGTGVRVAAKRERARRRPVEVNVTLADTDSWSLALPGGLPAGSDELEGASVQGRVVYAWLVDRGAVDYLETRFRLTVRSVAESTVVIRNIRARVQQTKPLDGTLIYSPTAGANSATLLVFDLDEPAPEAWEYAEDGGRERVGTSPYFHTNNVTLAAGEVHDFVIVGLASAHAVDWTLAVDLEIDGVAQEWEAIGPRGPFRTSGTPTEGFAATLDWAWWEGGRFLPTEVWDESQDA